MSSLSHPTFPSPQGQGVSQAKGAARDSDVQLPIIVQASSLHLVCWHTASHPVLRVFARDFTNQKNVAL